MPRLRATLGIAGLLALLLIAAWPLRAVSQGADAAAAWRQMFKRPSTPPPSPADNPLTADKIALGARLFADARLSGGGDRSCASCHEPDRAFTDGRRRALALSGAPLRRNTPSLWNLAWSKQFFWDGRAPSLETQVRMPIEAAAGDGRRLAGDRAAARAGTPALAPQFQSAFPREPAVSPDTVAEALAAYVRSLVSPPTRFDAWIDGDAQALRPAEVRGFGLFVGKAGCVLCHVGWRFTDDRFHDIGLTSTDGGRGGGAGRHAGPQGLQDAGPARARAYGALHARRLAGDARSGGRALRRRLRRAALAGARTSTASCA